MQVILQSLVFVQLQHTSSLNMFLDKLPHWFSAQSHSQSQLLEKFSQQKDIWNLTHCSILETLSVCLCGLKQLFNLEHFQLVTFQWSFIILHVSQTTFTLMVFGKACIEKLLSMGECCLQNEKLASTESSNFAEDIKHSDGIKKLIWKEIVNKKITPFGVIFFVIK